MDIIIGFNTGDIVWFGTLIRSQCIPMCPLHFFVINRSDIKQVLQVKQTGPSTSHSSIRSDLLLMLIDTLIGVL